MLLATTLLAALCCSCISPARAFGGGAGGSKNKQPKDAVLLSNVETLTLRGHGARTSHRRVPAIPQLSCISHPSLCRLVDPDVVRCTNQGSSYTDADVEWSCSAILPEEVRLGSTDVICEGYSSPDDPYVLKGSCGVEYRLALTAKGEERYPDLVNALERGTGGDHDPSAWVFGAVFIAILGWILYSAWINFNSNDSNNRRARGAPRRPGGGHGGDDYGPGGGGGGGYDPRFGGGFDGYDDPPPPYPGRKSTSSAGPFQRQPQESWRPGFWSGLAAGGAAGYAAGSRNRNTNTNDGSASWGTNRRSGGSPSSGSGAGPSGRSYEGTGFGSTSRR